MKKVVWWFGCYLLLSSGSVIANTLFSTDVPLVQEQQQTAGYWLQRLDDADRVLLSAEQITARNTETYRIQPELSVLDQLPDSYSAAELMALIRQISAVPSSPRFYASGAEVSQTQWQDYLQNANTGQIKARNPVRFGLVVRRTLMTGFPTADRVFNQEMEQDLNRFQETGLFPGEPVAILHQSQDKHWYLVRSYHYTGWVAAADIAQGSKTEVLAYQQQAPFLVITGAKAFTAYNPELADISELQLDMGVRLPLLSAKDTGYRVHGQNPLGSHIVKLPRRDADGQLVFTAALIPRSQDVHTGYLPFTAGNIVRQAFKFLGERYGWGHDYNGRDCTGFIAEIYRTFGLIMPRNSGQQGHGQYGRNTRFTADSSGQEKLAALHHAQAGDLIYLPGHVVMYLGTVNEQPFVIHDVNGLSYMQQDGRYYTGTLNGVVVTPLLPLHQSAENSYLDRVYNIKSLR
ncbi:SH3 domain-containing protein [Chromatiaceae bacterium AAb-1]|nr:SH3 domain-containing protein [Chromatiaceae bacterium AAb-1]